jgi:hypothetical protein
VGVTQTRIDIRRQTRFLEIRDPGSMPRWIDFERRQFPTRFGKCPRDPDDRALLQV